MSRFVSPPKDQLNRLRQPLTDGEKIVFDFFDRYLPDTWEIYLQPHLNGLRPDFVLLNPNVGIAVFEIKDWDLDALEYWMEPLAARPPVLMGSSNGEAFSLQHDNPIEKVRQYKEEIEQLYCPRLSDRAGYVVITAGVIFTCADDDEVRRLFEPSRQYHGMLEHKSYFPLVGENALHCGQIDEVFPENSRSYSFYMTAEHAKDLRFWLVEPDAPAEQRRPLELDSNQKSLVTTRTESGYRRIKGPAGSGKSLVLAARAAQLMSEGKQVLVVTFNITLMNYLKDLAVRWPHKDGKIRSDITWLNFHHWCKRVCQRVGREPDYYALWKNKEDEDVSPDPYDNQKGDRSEDILNSQLPALIDQILDNDANQLVPRYDAILVDEGQDFAPSWWRVLRKACKEDGEMLLVADATQDTYGRVAGWPDGAWTDRPMTGAGFNGPWAKLSTSYRTPPELIAFTRVFAERYLPSNTRDLPVPQQLELNLYPCQLRWVQTDKNHVIDTCLNEIWNLCRTTEAEQLAISDVTFLVDNNESGRRLVEALGKKGIRVLHTFSPDSKKSRKQKCFFFKGDARIKGTTMHSFKGWEARAIVVCIERAMDNRGLSLIYSGLTRVKRHVRGSYLTVVCAAENLADYGRAWPNFEKVQIAGSEEEKGKFPG